MQQIKKSFRLGGISTVYHDEETRQIFEDELNGGVSQSEFVANKLVCYAEQLGFDLRRFNIGDYPNIKEFFRRSRTVDYTYLCALTYLHEVEYKCRVPKSVIVRDAIKSPLC